MKSRGQNTIALLISVKEYGKMRTKEIRERNIDYDIKSGNL